MRAHGGTSDGDTPGAGSGGARVPSIDELLAIDRDAWRWLAGRARHVLNDLPATVEDPRLGRLRAVPLRKLVDGRARRDLAGLLSVGGAPWLGLLARLRDEPELRADLRWLVDGTAPPATRATTADGDELRREAARLAERLASAEDELARLRERVARRQQERDDARARAVGGEARATALAQQLAEATTELEALRAELASVRGELEQAAEATAAAVERERRRLQARERELERELTELRRLHQERREDDAARQRAEAVARQRSERQDQAERDAERAEVQAMARRRRAGEVARPGRPSTVPEHVEPGSTEFARALLTPVHRLYVDGYNVAKTLREDLPDESAERAWLLPRLARIAKDHQVPTTVFWDGQGAAEERVDRGVVQRFTAAGETADDDIVFEVELAPADQPIVVVTDDRDLRDRVAAHGVDLLHARTFGWLLQA